MLALHHHRRRRHAGNTSLTIPPHPLNREKAQILKELGYKAVLIQRVHYALKKRLAEGKDLEFMWHTREGPIFTQLMPYFSCVRAWLPCGMNAWGMKGLAVMRRGIVLVPVVPLW
jgi:hypothetical protein